MPPVLVDSILVDGSGNPIVDGSGNPIIILAGTDPADCECCGEVEPYPYCVNATLCDTEEESLFCRRSDLVSPPEVGKIYRVGGECYTVNSVTNGPEGGACDDEGFCVGTGTTLPWSPDEGPFDTCEECDPIDPCGGSWPCEAALEAASPTVSFTITGTVGVGLCNAGGSCSTLNPSGSQNPTYDRTDSPCNFVYFGTVGNQSVLFELRYTTVDITPAATCNGGGPAFTALANTWYFQANISSYNPGCVSAQSSFYGPATVACVDGVVSASGSSACSYAASGCDGSVTFSIP